MLRLNDNIIKFVDDETVYKVWVERLPLWCTTKNLLSITSKSKELIVDFTRCKPGISLNSMNGNIMEMVVDFMFLGSYINEDLMWKANSNSNPKNKKFQQVQPENLCPSIGALWLSSCILKVSSSKVSQIQLKD